MTAIQGYMFSEMGVSGTILCGREFMNTLADSSMEEIKQAIKSAPFLDAYYDMGENYIRTKNKNIYYSWSIWSKLFPMNSTNCFRNNFCKK